MDYCHMNNARCRHGFVTRRDFGQTWLHFWCHTSANSSNSLWLCLDLLKQLSLSRSRQRPQFSHEYTHEASDTFYSSIHLLSCILEKRWFCSHLLGCKLTGFDRFRSSRPCCSRQSLWSTPFGRKCFTLWEIFECVPVCCCVFRMCHSSHQTKWYYLHSTFRSTSQFSSVGICMQHRKEQWFQRSSKQVSTYYCR